MTRFQMALKACPYRKDFYAKLGDDLATVLQRLEAWLQALEKLLAIIAKLYPDQ